MCGIIGFISDKPTDQNYNMLGDLLYVSASRGTDATGIAMVGTDKVKVVKEDLPSDKFIQKYYAGLKKEVSRSKIVLGHTRLATQGHQRDNDNNHPIIGPKYVMVHNGTCPSMERLKDYKYKGTVDSEVLLSYIEKKGMKEGLKALKGSAAVAIVSSDEPEAVYLWRHNNPLWIAYNPEKKTIFFASTEAILNEGLSDLLNFFSSFHKREIIEDVLYKVTCDPLKIEAIEEIKPIGWSYTYQSRSCGKVNGVGTGWGYGYGDEGDWEKDVTQDTTTPLNSDTPTDDKASAEHKRTLSTFYKEILACKWDALNKVYTTEELPSSPNSTRYYFDGASSDFEHWKRLEGGGHVSIDKKLVKFFDHTRKAHFIMLVTDAIKEGLIDLSK
jgi:predicted glutamine amidotransferase